MKKFSIIYLVTILIFTLLVSLSGCQNNMTELGKINVTESSSNTTVQSLENENDIMPLPFGKNSSDTGGDQNMVFYSTVNHGLDYLDMSFIKLVDENSFKQWINSTSSSTSQLTAIDEMANLYSFISYFKIPDDTVKDILVEQRAFILSENINDDYFTDEEIDLILSKDNIAIATYFCSPYAIQKGENIYSPNWIYNHSTSDYILAGISTTEVEAKISYYSEFPLVNEAKNAFEKKLSNFTSTRIDFELSSKNNLDIKSLSINIGNNTYTVDWLISHNIQDYKQAGITTSQLSNILESMSEYKDTNEYNWIKSCFDRMLDDSYLNIKTELSEDFTNQVLQESIHENTLISNSSN